MRTGTAIIIGAGPAGLTAALELLDRTDITPIVVEKDSVVGGISRTVRNGPYLIDVGGHRFYSKSERVVNWWLDQLPIEETITAAGTTAAQRQTQESHRAPRMLIRERRSRIFFRRQLFDYPIALSKNTILKLGVFESLKALCSYLRARLQPRHPETDLETFFINRFGRYLYRTFFKEYTEKVWGKRCAEISAEWGAQRVKGLSLMRVVLHAVKRLLPSGPADIVQQGTETSLIERFMYPEEGPGLMWSVVADKVRAKGGRILLQHEPVEIRTADGKVVSVTLRDRSGSTFAVEADLLFSSAPIGEVAQLFAPRLPDPVLQAAAALPYRDFISIGVALEGCPEKIAASLPLDDNWIYVHDPSLKVGRIQIMNNWSPHMVKRPGTTLLALEYFTRENEDLWQRSEEELKALAEAEVRTLGLFHTVNVLDSFVIRQPKAYPAYFEGFEGLPIIRDELSRFVNLYPIGRNGQHRYNNQDHSMLTAMLSVDHVLGLVPKEAIWQVNADSEYLEEKKDSLSARPAAAEGENSPIASPSYWNNVQEAYERYPTIFHRSRFLAREIRRALKEHGPLRVFDLGCGNGSNLEGALKTLNGSGVDLQLFGFDLDPVAIDAARRRLPAATFTGTLESDLPPLDIVICSEVLEHTPRYRDLLQWAAGSLANNGMLILTTQSGTIHACDRYAGHTQHFDIEQLASEIRNAGFDVVTKKQWGFPFYSLQKWLTDLHFDAVRSEFLEGSLTLRKRIVFEAARLVFFVHDLLPLGPQIFITARKRRHSDGEAVEAPAGIEQRRSTCADTQARSMKHTGSCERSAGSPTPPG